MGSRRGRGGLRRTVLLAVALPLAGRALAEVATRLEARGGSTTASRGMRQAAGLMSNGRYGRLGRP